METSGNRTALGVSSDIAQLVGNRLRQARELLGRTTSALSAKIKVREHYLVAIEDGHWNELPPGLNGRGLVRIYARELSVAVPELDQAANQSVMPAEHDAQAPYQMGQKRDSSAERDLGQARAHVESPVPVVNRPTEQTPRTNTLASVQRHAKPNENQETRRTPAAGSIRKVIESTPEEEPLDVITPDVASILGITLDVIEESPKPKMNASMAAESRAVATAPVEPIQQSQKHFEVTQPKPQTELKTEPQTELKTELKTEETPRIEVQPGKKAGKKHGKNRSESREMAPRVIEHQEEVPLVMPQHIVEAPVPAHEIQQISAQVTPDASVLNQAVSDDLLKIDSSQPLEAAPAATPGVLAAETYIKSHSAEIEKTESESKESKSPSSMTRWAVGLMAACVAALIIGQVFVRSNNDKASSEASEAVAGDEKNSSGSSAESEKAIDAVEKNALAQNQSAAPTVESQPGALPQSQAGTPTMPEGAKVENAQPNPDSSVSDAKPSSPESIGAAAIPGQAAVSKAEEESVEPDEAPPANSVVASGTTAAVLTLSEALEIQVTADGKRIFSGKQNAGKMEIKFNKRAEIFVQDGSKAKLKYAGWDHGALGQEGRKRRIVLNAATFSGPGN